MQALSVVVDGFDERSDGYWVVALSTRKSARLMVVGGLMITRKIS